MRLFVALSLVAAMASSTAFSCSPPSAPTTFPDGKSAAMDKMVDAKKAVDQYRQDVQTYTACEKDASRADAVHAELERVASRFNSEVRAYKAANAGK
jgi:hypothetical protein